MVLSVGQSSYTVFVFFSPHETTGYDLCDKAVINPNREPRHQFSVLFSEIKLAPLTGGLGSLMTG